MGILGIENRTENWKTAESFAPFFECDSARTRLAKRLLEPLGTASEVQDDFVKIELYWKGMRDHIQVLDENHKLNKHDLSMRRKGLAERYTSLFPDLRRDIKKYIERSGSPMSLQTHNYNPMEDDEEFYNNLRNTEIDIVLATPKYLFVGEAKLESSFDVKYKYVLMHQLIRQYVLARILVNCREPEVEVVPFVVGDEPDKIKEPHPNFKHFHQISFLRDVGWLKEENVLSWDCIDEIAKSTPTAN